MRRPWVVGLALTACCPTAREAGAPTMGAPALETANASTDQPPTGEAWRAARAELAELRARLAPRQARTLHVKLAMDHAAAGRRLEARGAVAVGGDDGLRMILLGPGGTTALDLWICGDDYRYQVAALDMERRGRLGDGRRSDDEGRSGDGGSERGGFPVGFLRWWFLRRLEGRLTSYHDDGDGRRYVLRDGDDVIVVRGGEELTVSRGEETLAAAGGDCGRARYHHAGLGLTIEVTCERVAEGSPPARAFADPDDPGRACEGSGA